MSGLASGIRSTYRGRRLAATRGEVSRVWPGVLADIAGLVWWRGIWNPVRAAWHGPHPDAVYHSPTGGCPLCNPPAPTPEETPDA